MLHAPALVRDLRDPDGDGVVSLGSPADDRVWCVKATVWPMVIPTVGRTGTSRVNLRVGFRKRGGLRCTCGLA